MPLVRPTKKLHEGTLGVFYRILRSRRLGRRGYIEQRLEITVGLIRKQNERWGVRKCKVYSQTNSDGTPYLVISRYSADIAMFDGAMGAYHISQYLGVVSGQLDFDDKYAVRQYVKKVVDYLDVPSFVPGEK